MGIRNVGIIGTGVMGIGIARVLAAAGRDVTLVKWTEGTAEAARAKFEQVLMKEVTRGALASEEAARIHARIAWADAKNPGLERSDLVIEAVVEDEDEKLKCFAAVESALKQSAILASTTSSLGIEDMAKRTARPRLFLGLHFFNPPTAMRLVELIVPEGADPQCVACVREFLAEIGKEAVEVRDAPGFVVNRLLVAQFLEAIRAFQSGVADVAGIDACLRFGANHRMGPFELMDFIGLDVVLAMAENLQEGFRQQHFAPPPLLEDMVGNGWLGRKSGMGFYDYADRKKPCPNPGILSFVSGR